MKSLCVLPMSLVLSLLVGCATQPKPEMSSEDYTKFSKTWIGIHLCNNKGWISPDIAAKGKRFATGILNQYSYTVDRIDQGIRNQEAQGYSPTQGDCNELAMLIAEKDQQIAIHNQQVDNNHVANQEYINSTKLKNTYCNKIGTQVFCNTY